MATTPQKYWVPSAALVKNMQKLKDFVDFVATLDELSDADRAKVNEVKYLIENIGNPETYENWWVCIDVFDINLQYDASIKEGIYWRKWWVVFEDGLFEVSSEARNKNYDEESYFDCCVTFRNDFKGERIFGEVNFDAFVAQALNFRSCLTNTLNNVEAEIAIW